MSLPDGILVACVGDDFTGSAASMEALEFAGVPAVLLLDIPTPEKMAQFPDVRAIGIATTARSHTPEWMEQNLPPVFAFLKSTGAPVIHYKVCSTLDSAPHVGSIAHQFIDKLKPGAAVIVLDAAAPYAGEMPRRADVTYFCTHPCHPHILEAQDSIEAQKDYFGGIAPPQGIVCALIQGPDEHYTLCEEIAKIIYAPVARSHRCTLQDIAILEPALSETVAATMALALRDATDRAVSMGVPEAAAHDFVLGHLKIELAIAFGIFPEGKFSDGALMAIDKAKSVIFKEDWLDEVFSLEAVKKSVQEICAG